MTAPRWDHHLLPGERLLWQGRPQRFAQGVGADSKLTHRAE